MYRRMSSKARGGSATSTTSAPFEAVGEGFGSLNMSLKTGDEKDRKGLWTRKSRLSVPWVARRITSASGQLNISSDSMRERVVVAPRNESGACSFWVFGLPPSYVLRITWVGIPWHRCPPWAWERSRLIGRCEGLVSYRPCCGI